MPEEIPQGAIRSANPPPAERSRLRNGLARILSFWVLEEDPGRGGLRSLLLVSFAALYMEMVLIRWIGTEVGVFAYFQNLALIACFLGFGLGCYQASLKRGFLFNLTALAYLITLVALPFPPLRLFIKGLSNSLGHSAGAALWSSGLTTLRAGGGTVMFVLSLVAVTAFLVLIIYTMIPLGQWVGFYLDRAQNPVRAYTVNLSGSLAGIWVFAAAAFLWIPPVYWFGFAFLMFLLARPRTSKLTVPAIVLILASLAVLASAGAGNFMTIWSPYQELQVNRAGNLSYNIRVNDAGYMTIADLPPALFASEPALENSSYDAPFRFVPDCGSVLIVGAGAGNDAAAALRHCSGQINAVEIDPAIYYLGESLHPQHPYRSPRVHVILTDARAYMRNARGKYDVILFGLLDSHTDISGFSNMRIDNYVYTEQAFEEARRLLAPDGVLILKFVVRNPWTWMGQRFYRTLAQVFGHAPIVFHAGQVGPLLQATVFLESNSSALSRRAEQPQLATLIRDNPPPFSLRSPNPPPVATDNWPYVYQRRRAIPSAYLLVPAVLLLLSLIFVRSSFKATQRSTWVLFFLGAGFMLLEAQLVSRLALYFGSTWIVNCVPISAILLVLVIANIYVEMARPARLGPYYAILIASLGATYLFPWDSLHFSAHLVGILLSVAYAVCLFPAGVVFTETFRQSDARSSAFAANIVGAVAGGLVQNLSFILGIRDLLLLAALLYVAALACAKNLSGAAVSATIASGSETTVV